jgi:phage shock protein E
MKLTLISGIMILSILLTGIILLWAWALNSPFRISPEAARALLRAKKVDVLLDVRTQLEREQIGSAKGSIHIPAANLDKSFETKYPNKDILILIYCNTGQRARAAAEKLHQFGYLNSLYITAPHTSLYSS